MERWLLISNCQTFGLANSIKLLNPDFDVDGIDIWSYRADIDHYNARMSDYFRVIVHPEVTSIAGSDLSLAHNVSTIPSIYFPCYHPDVCSVTSGTKVLSGEMGEYHSIIAVAAFNAGLSPADAKSLYRSHTYQTAGYYDGWSEERDHLIAHFRHFGLDISSSFARWARGSAFMYSVNHARIDVIYDIAKIFMETCGVPTFETDIRPVDNLLSGPCYPIYDEVAERLSIRGSYLFKRMSDYRYSTLDQFIANSYSVYANADGPVEVVQSAQARYDRVQAVIRGEA